jgi:hypothetical protein
VITPRRAVCEDSVERDRWLANVRAALKRPFARYCFACATYAQVPPTSAYAVAGTHRALVMMRGR